MGMTDSVCFRWNNVKFFCRKTAAALKCSKFKVMGSLHSTVVQRTLRTMCVS